MTVFSAEALARGVRDAMQDSGLSAHDLSARTGIPFLTLSRLLAGRGRTFEVGELAAISEHVGLTLLELAARSITAEAMARLGPPRIARGSATA